MTVFVSNGLSALALIAGVLIHYNQKDAWNAHTWSISCEVQGTSRISSVVLKEHECLLLSLTNLNHNRAGAFAHPCAV